MHTHVRETRGPVFLAASHKVLIDTQSVVRCVVYC